LLVASFGRREITNLIIVKKESVTPSGPVLVVYLNFIRYRKLRSKSCWVTDNKETDYWAKQSSGYGRKLNGELIRYLPPSCIILTREIE